MKLWRQNWILENSSFIKWFYFLNLNIQFALYNFFSIHSCTITYFLYLNNNSFAMINRYFPLKYTTFSHWFKFICKCLCCLLHVIVFIHIRNKGQLFLKDSSKSVKKWTDWENVKLSFLSLGTINLFCSRNMSSICYWHKSVFYIVNISF